MTILSVVIPSYKDPLITKTIQSLLDNSELGQELEIVNVWDGFYPNFPLVNDPRVKVVHLGRNRGMRGAINAGVLVSKGTYIMRTDEHCSFSPGYDRTLTENIENNWIVSPRRYALDPIEWKIMPEVPPVDYMKLKIVNTDNGPKFSGVDWPARAKDRADWTIDETMAIQGSCWIMSRSWWDSVIGELQTEGYGPLTQDSHEMQFKTWQAGGKLMVNKNAWHAHKHRSFPRSHNGGTPENPAAGAQSYAYALSVWREYFETVVVPEWASK